jgi:outer membrane immunogenic protein
MLSAALSNSAMAADLLKAPPAPIPMWGWTEFYFGISIGYADAQTSWCTDANAANCLTGHPVDIFNQKPSGITNGGEFGYRYQIPNTPAVVGVEAMIGGLSANTTAAGVPSPATLTRYTQFNNLESVTGQLGFAIGRTLVYGKGGWAATELHLDADNTVTGADLSTYKWVEDGWTAGAGIDYQLFTHFSVGFEYNYYQFNVGNVSGLVSTAGGGPVACSFCDFGRTSVQTFTGHINIKLWPWGP